MYVVTLSHAKNPDIPGGYWEQMPRDPSARAPVASIAEAARKAREYIERNHLGGGNWTGGDVHDAAGAKVARISFNGRAWGPAGEEIK